MTEPHYRYATTENAVYPEEVTRLRPRSGRVRTILLVVAVVLGLSGTGLIWTGVTRPVGLEPVAEAGTIPEAGAVIADPPAEAPVEESQPSASPAPRAVATPLGRSAPVSIEAPSIGVTSTLLSLGLNQDRTVEVPKDFSKAGWYRNGPTPGETGASVILGHVDSVRGPAVFFQLAKLKPGDKVRVKRSDGKTATFTVDARRQYPKAKFPAKDVYGEVDYPGLRLVTCGGEFDSKARSYLDNIVVYAHLSATTTV
ncbi:class F sortase [Amycolatopsis sp.]|uniref:class F sortase n=1 Tax=Amycolatopsis sp. TaxID=37632 RepID=UPI002DFF2C18|nr:class F sortase [Amycolatopsis sp.]